MRRQQRIYFENRYREALSESKRLEKECDKHFQELEKLLDGDFQTTLF